MINVSLKTDHEIDQWIHNHEQKSATSAPLYLELLEERARRSKKQGNLDIDKSLQVLSLAAIEQRCVTYGDLAKASNVEWSKARHKMNGANGHLDRLLDICHVRGIPMLPAICVNESGRKTGELEPTALKGFAVGARRLGLRFTDDLAFHHKVREECWRWGENQKESGDRSHGDAPK